MGDSFAVAEGRWQQRLGKLRDVVRQELVARQLAENLPAERSRVLDVGCGQGTQAIQLARAGHQVTGLDVSAELLGRFQADLAAEPEAVRRRVRTVHASLEDMAELFAPDSFDVVLCHGVLMYFPDPEPVLAAIEAVIAPGGVVSLLVRNGDAMAMRPGLLGDWRSTLDAFDTTNYRNRIGVLARGDHLDELTTTLRHRGMPVTRWYGVRVFTDAAANDAEPPAGSELDNLIACEERAGRTDPYRRVAALLHLLALRDEPDR